MILKMSNIGACTGERRIVQFGEEKNIFIHICRTDEIMSKKIRLSGYEDERRKLPVFVKAHEVGFKVKSGFRKFVFYLLLLQNHGNTCYLNASLQILKGMPMFCEDTLRLAAVWDFQGEK